MLIVHRSVDEEKMEDELKAIREITRQYSPRDTYNADETALFCRRSPMRSLATASEPGQKVQKSRITIAVCGNADGSDKVSISYLFRVLY
jgi:hypothetical protein